MKCNDPGPNRCKDATTLVTREPIGICSLGSCEYAPIDVACQFGCQAGACKDDPCKGVVCSRTTANRCKDGKTLVVPSPSGTCEAGSCQFQDRELSCEFGCEAGACKADPCAGKVCNKPDAAYCAADGRSLVTFAPLGTCTAGLCEYERTVVACEHGCERGQCKQDPCAGVACAERVLTKYCSGRVSVTESETGTCRAGRCERVETRETCEHGCSSGRCLDDPCRFMTCNQGFGSRCKDDLFELRAAREGTCKAGRCEYPWIEKRCTFGCETLNATEGSCRAKSPYACQGGTFFDPRVNSCVVGCLVDGVVYRDREPHPTVACLQCRAELSRTAWSASEPNTACPGGMCDQGFCRIGACAHFSRTYPPGPVENSQGCAECVGGKMVFAKDGAACPNQPRGLCSLTNCFVDACLVGTSVIPEGSSSVGGSGCEVCVPSVSRTSLSPAPQGQSCSSFKACDGKSTTGSCTLTVVNERWFEGRLVVRVHGSTEDWRVSSSACPRGEVAGTVRYEYRETSDDPGGTRYAIQLWRSSGRFGLRPYFGTSLTRQALCNGTSPCVVTRVTGDTGPLVVEIGGGGGCADSYELRVTRL
jgi:hypothetical protein